MPMREAALDFADRLAKSPAERRLAVDSCARAGEAGPRAGQLRLRGPLEPEGGQRRAGDARQSAAQTNGRRAGRCQADQGRLGRRAGRADALQENPKDSAAAAAWGKFCCVYKGDWDAGLPLLAAGSGDDLCELARQDQRQSNLPADQAKLGDQWWAAAATQKEPLARKNVQGRAVVWYRRAVPWLPEIAQTPLKERIDKHDQLESLFPWGEWVEVLGMVDTDKHAVRGPWSRQGTEINVQRFDQGRCTIPVNITGSYDLEVRLHAAGREGVELRPAGWGPQLCRLRGRLGRANGRTGPAGQQRGQPELLHGQT